MNVSNAADFGRVAVMFGGHSSEREVSLDTGAAVLKALQSKGVDAHAWDPAEKTMTEFAGAGFDRVWIALHGPGGEDGALQGLLQWLGVPYTGSGVMASALAMDKVRSKHLFRAVDIPTPDYAVVKTLDEASVAAEQVGFPLIIKPSGQGSSVGMSKVFERNELNDAVEVALQYGDTVLLETCINGDEFTVAVLHGKALPSIRIVTPRVFYDYRAKYESDRTEYICRGTASDEEETLYAELAVAAFNELGCSGWGRVDFMTGADKQPLVLEVNTVPGMTSHSLVPMAANQDGIDFETLCWRILETSFDGEVDHGA
ncbi:MAG: D-alanine--D-alanine ligase [Gammaproteobacteria bacterium]|nr:D-alanine--D-alanine ligase [Gammaproteobacteria bacterium]MDH3812256.1 D-alanine--D-alanine ligase [Gammaproteobacteria bacterium]